MSPTAKDLEVTNSSSTTPAGRPASVGAQEENAGRPQPVPLEVPVTVNGARTVEGSDKREPFSETTQTVLVFGNGAVIRLASTVAAGQLLFLTNDKTKKEVVCQVVKSKNYRNVSGYVELEFTEPIAGFWGMRFPGERTAAQPGTSGAAPAPRPAAPVAVAPKLEAPAASIPQRVEMKPAPVSLAPAPPVPAKPATTTSSTLNAEVKPALNLPRTADSKPITTLPSLVHPTSPLSVSSTTTSTTIALPRAPGLTDGFGSGLTSTARPTESKPATPVAPKAPPAPAAAQPSSDALRRESERLQEQLASMLFAAEVPPTIKPTLSQPSKVVEIAKPQTPAAKAPPPKSGPVQLPSALDAEEVKIPSWLEPLARNAATQAQNEIAMREDSAQNDRVIEFEVQDVSAPHATQKEQAPVSAEPAFPTHLLDESATPNLSKGSNKGVLLGAIAAGLLLAVAGGTWYARRSTAPAPVSPAVTATATEPAAVAPSVAQGPTRTAAQTATRGATETPNRSNINSEPVAQSPSQTSSSPTNSPSVTPASQLLKVAPDKYAAAELSAYRKLAEPQPVVKRPSIGEVHLGAPKSNRTATSTEVGEDATLALNATQVAPTGDAFGGGLAVGSGKQPVAPAAPLPIGGDVRAARLLSSTPPVYPTLAKTQHVQGAVRVDALVDAAGKISSMKVVSGPVLLHQAAMDALRQWKYQAATLDGKPVPMHLTVTVQFRLQ
jgi:TonB family protein